MSEYLQEPPNAVQIELVEGCNLRCPFCGLNGIREPKQNNLKFMKEVTLITLCNQMVGLGWNPRIEFAMHGEPTLHPDAPNMVNIVRSIMPKQSIMMTSNGGGLLKPPGPSANLKALFEAGLNVFALDCYEYVSIHTKVRESVAAAPAGQFEVYEYPANPAASPHTRRKPKEHALIYVKDISVAEKGTHSTLNNHAGSGAAPNLAGAGKRCAKPFRELSVRWDGNVAVCCNDWRGVYKCGHIEDLAGVWNGPPMQAARKYLYAGQRSGLEPCAGCDATSYRVGILPDRMGKDTLAPPTPRDAKEVARATRGPTYTAAVPRPWELVKLGRKP